MKNKITYYHLILDRSGSMNSCIEQTVAGVNGQIQRIKEVAEKFPEQELITSLTLFNHKIVHGWTRLDPKQLREITFSDFRPEGTTALLDAVGITVKELQEFAGPQLEVNEVSIVVVIITDGYENSSRLYRHEQLAGFIKDLEATGKWTFSYIGATLDAVDIASNLNIKTCNAMYFSVDESMMMYNKLNKSVSSYIEKKQAGKISPEFLENED